MNKAPLTKLKALSVILAAIPVANAETQEGTNRVLADANTVRSLFSDQALKDIFGDRVASFDFAKVQSETEVGRRFYDIFVNGTYLIRQQVELYRKDNGSIDIKIPAQVLFIQQLRFDELPDLSNKMPMDLIDNLPELIPGAEVRFDTLKARAEITVPQSWYKNSGLQGDIVPYQRWTYGIPALAVNYRANADIRHYDSEITRHGYLDFDGRFNFNEWRIVADGSFSYDEDQQGSQTDFDRGNLYVTRVFGSSKTRFRAGEIYTQSFYMDSVPLLGVEFYDDEMMLSSIERSYTPVVSGIAQSPARVTVRQFGRVVFERNVPAGPFSFEDLPGLSTGTDLEVTITEQNGQIREFTVPYVSTPLLLRAGRLHFNVAAGRWKDNHDYGNGENPFVMTAGVGYGLPFDASIFAGTQISENYRAGTIGAAVNLGRPGAFSLQFDHSAYDLTRYEDTDSGSRFRVQWSNRITAIGSYLSASWRHYLSGRYLSLAETLTRRGSESWFYSNYDGSLKDEVSLAFTQPFGRFGSVSLSGSWYEYDDDRLRQNVSASYTTNWRGATLTLSLQHYRNKLGAGYDEKDTICFLNVSVPLSLFAGYKAASHSINLGVRRNNDGHYETTEGVSGTFGENNRWNYSVSASQYQDSDSYYASIGKEAEYGRFSLSASHDDYSTSYTGSLDGSIIATKDGIYPARTLNGASALLTIPNAPKARPDQFTVSSRIGDKVLVTGLNNYRINEVAINPNTIPPNVSMPVYIKRMVPADDAILEIPFETMIGWQFVPELRYRDGSRLPFGTTVRIVGNEILTGMDTVLNIRARAYFPAAPAKGVIEAIWEENNVRKTCWAPYNIEDLIKKKKNDNRAIRSVVTCLEKDSMD